MRYLSWDVLLFPGNSRVPLQEFDTKCHVLFDHNDRLIDNAAFSNIPYLGETESMPRVPVLTSFVSSLEPGTPFRVSIHSWEAPKASDILRTFKSHDELVAYEARVYVDGIMVAHRIFSDQAVWPEVIEFTGNMSAAHSKPMRFPSFHPEILQQAHWEPGETYGRIRVIVAKGVTNQVVDDRTGPVFDRLRDIIAFSFQHAPRHILQHSAIAWPNPQMFRGGIRAARGNITSRMSVMPDPEAHAHSSPHRQPNSNSSKKLFESIASGRLVNGEPSGESNAFEDPFVGPRQALFHGKSTQIRTNGSNYLVKDYNSIRTARSHAGTDMSGISYAKPDFERAMNEAAIDEIVEALSPERKLDLLHALDSDRKDNPEAVQTTWEAYSAAAKGKGAEVHVSQTNSLPPLPTSDKGHRASVPGGNLYASRYASVPLLSPSTTLRSQSLSQALRNSFDPILPCSVEELSNQAKVFAGQRARSSSNGSKRKRQESPGNELAAEVYNVASMSTSPCKGGMATPMKLDNSDSVLRGATLSQQDQEVSERL